VPFDAKTVFEMNPLTLYDEMLERAAAPRIEARRKPSLLASARAY
jgi:hypothetical protein